MAQIFDIVVENAVLSAKSTILEEAAGTPAGERYVYIVEAAGDTLKKAKEFVVKNKGKLAALAGLAALGGAGVYAYNKGMFADAAAGVAEKAKQFAEQQRQIQNQLHNQHNNQVNQNAGTNAGGAGNTGNTGNTNNFNDDVDAYGG